MKKLIFPLLVIMFAFNVSANVTEKTGPKPKMTPTTLTGGGKGANKSVTGGKKAMYHVHRKATGSKGKPFGKKKHHIKLVNPK